MYIFFVGKIHKDIEMTKPIFAGVTAAGMTLGASFAQAETLALLTIFSGDSTHSISVNVTNTENCKSLAYNALGGDFDDRYAYTQATVSCIEEGSVTGYICKTGTESLGKPFIECSNIGPRPENN